jgi:uncharacterized protein YdeI (YjbR/CyaY-like superfamily)
MFCKGALLNDPNGMLKTFGWQAARRIRFTNVREIAEMEPILKPLSVKPLKRKKPV